MAKTRFARLITMRARQGKGDEFVKTFRDGVAKTAVEIGGMRRLYLLRQVGKDDEFVVLSLWDNQRAAEKYANSGENRRYAEILATVQVGKERVEKLCVEAHVVGKGAGRGKA